MIIRRLLRDKTTFIYFLKKGLFSHLKCLKGEYHFFYVQGCGAVTAVVVYVPDVLKTLNGML